MGAALRGLSTKVNSRTLENFTVSGLRLVWVHQEPGKGSKTGATTLTLHARVAWSNQLLLNQRQCQEGEKEKPFAFHFESLKEECRVIESKLLEVQYEASTFSDDLGYHVTCWCWWLVQAAGWLSEDFRALHLLTSFMQMLNLFFQQALAPAHWTKTTTKYVLNMVAPSSIGQPTHPSWTP